MAVHGGIRPLLGIYARIGFAYIHIHEYTISSYQPQIGSCSRNERTYELFRLTKNI
jgi:hypothetical protein